jgi:L-aspartate semialdehyde sulfurtransferase
MKRTIAQINEKIRGGDAVILRADQMSELVKDKGVRRAAREVDIVTTGTFGAMCSSGAFMNFGHSNPPIKMRKIWLNEVEAYGGLAAVDAYIGATQESIDCGMEYGGGHVIEDLVGGSEIQLRALSHGTDCYPKTKVETTITLSDLNQAYLFNPRNNYQRYACAVNYSERKLNTYMGTLLPGGGNINYAGTGHISPLNNDPQYATIGFGTKIFLGGAQGRIVGPGTQHSPQTGFGNIACMGDLKGMKPKYLRGATIPEYGSSLFVGIGVPIPILNDEIAKSTGVTNDEITAPLLDYGLARSDRPVVKHIKYSQLMSGSVDINGVSVKTAPLSSLKMAYEIMDELAKWILKKEYYFQEGIEPLPKKSTVKPMRVKHKTPDLAQVMTVRVEAVQANATLKEVSGLMIKRGVDQIPVIDSKRRVIGIVTALDLTKAHALGKTRLMDVMTKNVVCSKKTDSIEEVSRRLEKHGFNSTPVVDKNGRLSGIITTSDINRVYGVGK